MEVIEYEKDFYILDDGKVRAFLIIGGFRAILIDTGFEEDHIIEEVRKLTNKQVDVILTHGHRDHIGGLSSFRRCYINARDAHMISCPISITYLKNHDEISIGNYCFEILEIPGHTYGSIALYERKKKLLLPGDSVQIGPIYMFGQDCDLNLYIESLMKLKHLQDIEIILPSHHQHPLQREYIDYCLEDATALKNNQLVGVLHPHLPCHEYKGKHISFYYG